MNQRSEQSEKEWIWRLLSEAGLIDIRLDELPQRVKEAKDVVVRRLSELLEGSTDIHERQSAAYSLATLKKLQNRLGRDK